MKKKLLFIKLGGSILTDKTVEKSVQYDVLRSLVSQIKQILEERPNLQLVIGHGQGSFAHYPAKKYRIHEGFVDPDAKIGCAVTLDVVAQLNRIIITEMLVQKLPAVSLFPSQICTARDGTPQSTYLDTLEEYLRLDLIPVMTGDVIVDAKNGSTIWSADFLLPYFARSLRTKGWQIDSIIHVTKTPGVYKDVTHLERGVFDFISPQLFDSIAHTLGSAEGVDITGGMLEKVSHAVELAQDGIETIIVNNDDNNLAKAVCEGIVKGTKIISQSSEEVPLQV